MTFVCKIHHISLKIEGKTRQFETSRDSIAGIPQCRLLTIHPVVEGKFGQCEIEEVKDA